MQHSLECHLYNVQPKHHQSTSPKLIANDSCCSKKKHTPSLFLVTNTNKNNHKSLSQLNFDFIMNILDMRSDLIKKELKKT